MNFKTCAPPLVPTSPTFNLVKPLTQNISSQNALSDKGKGIDFKFEKEPVKAWEGERIHEVGLDYLELTLGSGGMQ